MFKKMIDIGANLTDPMFRGIYNSSRRHRDDFDDMLQRAKNGGVEKIIVTGGSLKDSREALELAKSHENMFSTVGCHPTRCNEFESHPSGPDFYLEELSTLAQTSNSKVVAIGELGLDYHRLHFCPAEVQKRYFERQLDLALSLKLPLFLHNRDSIDDFVDILERNAHKFKPAGGVIHSFDGKIEDLERVLQLGLYVGVNGCSLKTEENLTVVKEIPSDRLMIETDCPWCETRRTHAGYKHINSANLERSKNASDPKLAVKGRNEPMNLAQVLEVLAAVRGEDIVELSEQIYKNTNKLFFDK